MATTSSTTESNPASALYAALGATKAQETSRINETQNRFLKLLTAQMKNQDPLNPMDNAQMTSQMAQISTVDGIERLNATFQALLGDSANTQAVQAAALIGKGVLVPGNAIGLPSDGAAYAGIDLAADADKVTVSVRDGNGLLVRTLNLGSVKAGSHTFSWDGTANDGREAAVGDYTFTVAATQGTNEVETTPLDIGLVTSVTRGSAGLSLNVGQRAYSLADVRQIL